MNGSENWPVVVAAVLLALGTPANAQTAGTFTQSDDGTAPTVAAELFGPGTGVKLEFGKTDFDPVYKLTYVQATDAQGNADATNSVESGDQGMITYTLSGATFAERVSPNDFAVTGDAGATVAIDSGGSRGDASVVIEVTAAAAWTGSTVVAFDVPDLTATDRGATNPVRMGSSYSINKTSNFPEGGPRNKACGERNADGTQASARGCRIVAVSPYIAGLSIYPGNHRIDLANRANLLTNNENLKHLAERPIGLVQIGTASPGAVMDSDGDPIKDFTGDLAGDVVISLASSQFRERDVVYIDDNLSRSLDDLRERFTIADGVAIGDRALTLDALTNFRAMRWPIWYQPNGKDPLTHGTELVLSAKTDFAKRGNMNIDAKARDGAKTVTSTLSLDGIKPNPAMAYAIAPLGSEDTANTRITCESGTTCNVFLSCHDQAGNDYFGDAGVEIAANATVRLDQAGIGAALGLEDGAGWSGRLSCEVLSTAPISVQLLTRAAGVLVNNTYVGEGGK